MQQVPNTQIPPAPPRPVRRIWRALALVVPSLACALCLALAVMFVETQLAPPAQVQVEVPVTGAETPTPSPTLTAPPVPERSPVQILTPADDYGVEAELRLALCDEAFEHFFILQHLAAMDPGLIRNNEWRTDAEDAVEIFQRDCALAEGLPDAPSVYSEVDHWMRLAATEVDPAAEKFAIAVDQKQSDGLFETSIHLARFFEYTAHAHAAMQAIRLRREI